MTTKEEKLMRMLLQHTELINVCEKVDEDAIRIGEQYVINKNIYLELRNLLRRFRGQKAITENEE